MRLNCLNNAERLKQRDILRVPTQRYVNAVKLILILVSDGNFIYNRPYIMSDVYFTSNVP
jgi:hypothetical protein